MKSAVMKRCKKAMSVLAATSVILTAAVSLSNYKAYAWENDSLDKANINGDFSKGLISDNALIHTADTSSVTTVAEDGNVKISIKRKGNDASTGSLSKRVYLPAGDYVWQFELSADSIPTDNLKQLIYFGVFNSLDNYSRGYGTNGLAAAATYISEEKPESYYYCNSLDNFNYNFYLTNRSLQNSNSFINSCKYYVSVSFSLKEARAIYLSMTNADSTLPVKTDNWYIYSANEQTNADSFEYYRPETYPDNFSYDTAVKRSGYRSLKCASSLGNTQILQPIYDSFGCNYMVEKENKYRITFYYKITEITDAQYIPFQIYPVLGIHSSNADQIFPIGFDNSEKAVLTDNAVSSDWKKGIIEFWADPDLFASLKNRLSIAVKGKGTLYFDDLTVENLGNPLDENTYTVNKSDSYRPSADNSDYFLPYGAVLQNGIASAKNSDGSFKVDNGKLTLKYYSLPENKFTSYNASGVKRTYDYKLDTKSNSPGILFESYLENYSSENSYGTLIIRNSDSSILNLINDDVKKWLITNYKGSGWNTAKVSGTTVSFTVVKNRTAVWKSGNGKYQFAVKLYGDYDASSAAYNGISFKDLNYSAIAYGENNAKITFASQFVTGSYSDSIYYDISYSETPSVTDHAGTGGILPLFWYLNDKSLEAQYTEEQLEFMAKRLKSMNISVVRCQAFQPGFSWDSVNNCWSTETDYMKAFYRYADIMKKYGISIIINPTEGILTSSQAGEPLPNAEYFKTDYNNDGSIAATDVYADWTAWFVKNIVVGKNYTNVKYLMYATEPNNRVSDDAAAFANYIEFIKAADNALKADNIRYKIKVVGPNVAYDKLLDSDGYLLTKTVSWLENAVKYNELFDIYSAHTYVKCESFETDTYNYCDEFSEQCLKAIKSTGKTLWYDEFNAYYRDTCGGATVSRDMPLRGTQLALSQISLMNKGISGSFIWSLFDYKWTDSLKSTDSGYEAGYFNFGLDRSVLKSDLPYNAYYAFSILGTAIKNGDKVYPGNSPNNGLYTAKLVHTDNSVSYVAVNMTENNATVNFKADGNFIKYVYDPQNIKVSSQAEYTPDGLNVNADTYLTDKIGSYQVSVYNQIK